MEVTYQGSPLTYTATGALNTPNLDISHYQIVRELGRGAFGITYLAADNLGDQYAVKLIDYQAAVNKGATMADILEEGNSLTALASGTCNPYLVCYYGSWDFTYQGSRYIALVSDFVDGMTLRDWLAQPQNTNLPPTTLWPLITQLMLGLQFVHKSGYAHRDIKPENIMITKDLHIKYIDFGLACTRSCNGSVCVEGCTGEVGTVLYESPEIFNGTYRETLASAQKRDIWALILVCYELAGGNFRLPFTVSDSVGQWLPISTIVQNIQFENILYPSYAFQDDGRTSTFLYRNVIRDPLVRPDVEALLASWTFTVVAVPLISTQGPNIITGDRTIRTQLAPVTIFTR